MSVIEERRLDEIGQSRRGIDRLRHGHVDIAVGEDDQIAAAVSVDGITLADQNDIALSGACDRFARRACDVADDQIVVDGRLRSVDGHERLDAELGEVHSQFRSTARAEHDDVDEIIVAVGGGDAREQITSNVVEPDAEVIGDIAVEDIADGREERLELIDEREIAARIEDVGDLDRGRLNAALGGDGVNDGAADEIREACGRIDERAERRKRIGAVLDPRSDPRGETRHGLVVEDIGEHDIFTEHVLNNAIEQLNDVVGGGVFEGAERLARGGELRMNIGSERSAVDGEVIAVEGDVTAYDIVDRVLQQL